MPYRRGSGRRGRLSRKRRAFRRRAAYRLRRRRRRRYRLARAVLPRQKLIKFVYSRRHTQVGTGTANIPYVYTFNANSCYDPDNTGGGTQPTGWDQWSAFYRHYCVLASRITVTWINPTSDCVVYLGAGEEVPSALGSNGPQGLLETGTGRARLLRQETGKPLVMRATWSGRKYYGASFLTDEIFRATTANNPSKLFFFNIASVNMDPGIIQPTLYCRVTIEYITKMFDPVTLGPS